MGDVTRFYTRAMMMAIAEMTENYGWSSRLVLNERVLEELGFWKENMSVLNGHRMRKLDKVVEMFSDGGEFMVGGAQFMGEVVKEETRYKQHLEVDEQCKSSTYRELRALEEGLKTQGKRLQGHLD